MSETKAWYQSIGIWAALVTILSAALRLFRVELDPQLQRDLADWLLSAATVGGAGAALWGRWRASRRIAVAGAPPGGSSSGPPNESNRIDQTGVILRRLLAISFFCWAAACVAGCAGVSSLGTPGAAYIAADRATYDAVAPDYRGYCDADPNLTADEKGRRLRTIDTWRLRFESAERSAPNATQAKNLTADE